MCNSLVVNCIDVVLDFCMLVTEQCIHTHISSWVFFFINKKLSVFLVMEAKKSLKK